MDDETEKAIVEAQRIMYSKDCIDWLIRTLWRLENEPGIYLSANQILKIHILTLNYADEIRGLIDRHQADSAYHNI